MSHCCKWIFLAVLIFAAGVATSATGPAGTQPTSEPAVKFHPGHWVALTETQEIGAVKHLDEPALVGVSRRYYWADLEPAKDHYDFASVRADLATCKEHKKQLIVFITDKTFGGGKNPLPKYLAEYALPNMRAGGVTAERWDPVVVARFVALSQALAKEFDANDNFEGIATEESALMISADVRKQHGYTPEKYRDALIKMLTESSKAFARSRVFWYMNHLEDGEGYLEDVAKAVVGTHVVMGGPDILPYRKRLQQTYQLYGKFAGKLPLFCSAQDDSYRHDKNDSRNMGTATRPWAQAAPAGGYVPLEEIFAFARDQLHVNYVFWSCKYNNGQGAFSYDDALAVMKGHPQFNTAGK